MLLNLATVHDKSLEPFALSLMLHGSLTDREDAPIPATGGDVAIPATGGKSNSEIRDHHETLTESDHQMNLFSAPFKFICKVRYKWLLVIITNNQ